MKPPLSLDELEIKPAVDIPRKTTSVLPALGKSGSSVVDVSFVSGVVEGTVEVSGVVDGAEVDGAEVGAAASKDFQ